MTAAPFDNPTSGVVRLQGLAGHAPAVVIPVGFSRLIADIAAAEASRDVWKARAAAIKTFATSNEWSLASTEWPLMQLAADERDRPALRAIEKQGHGGLVWDHPLYFRAGRRPAAVIVDIYGELKVGAYPSSVVIDRLPFSLWRPKHTQAFLLRPRASK
jgi:hypothetical protein